MTSSHLLYGPLKVQVGQGGPVYVTFLGVRVRVRRMDHPQTTILKFYSIISRKMIFNTREQTPVDFVVSIATWLKT